MSRDGDWMQTFTGKQFWPMDPRVDEVCIADIAHALSMQCRYAGHCTEFYSVAEHSVRVSWIVPAPCAMWGLLHDASEAYLVDLPRPIKRYSALGDRYREIEERLMLVIAARFGLGDQEPSEVKDADDVMLMTEKRDLMPNSPAKWRETSEPLASVILPWAPAIAEQRFMHRYEHLLGDCGQSCPR